MPILLEYKAIREYPEEGRRGKRRKTIYRWADDGNDLKVGGLYVDLEPGLPGFHRILSVRPLEAVREEIE